MEGIFSKVNNNTPFKGLNTDVNPSIQPENSYRYALNVCVGSFTGDEFFMSNEESNIEDTQISEGYIIIGKRYIGNNNTVLFLVNDANDSEIGIFNTKSGYESHVNDSNYPKEFKLNFSKYNQIDCIYRLRKGCERTIYWVDGDRNKPRYFNFDKPYAFKTNHLGQDYWNASKFELYKTFSSIPNINDLEISSGGMIKSGSYNFAVRLLDSDFNPTEFITVSDTVVIYSDTNNKTFSEISGSTTLTTSYRDFPITNKSIKIHLGNLDKNYSFFQIAIIAANTGLGDVNEVGVSPPIDINSKVYTFTGEYYKTITEEEVVAFNSIIDRAYNIEQIDNMLILGNTLGKSVDSCKLQKYASKIVADVVLEKIYLNIDIKNNPKSALTHINKIGYMPGEIYSFAIVWMYKDGSVSPAYTIPGKSSKVNNNYTYQNGSNIRPMSNIDNTCSTTLYTSNSNQCIDIWGVDYHGDSLLNKNVRHHRFPLRSEINEPLYIKENNNTANINRYTLLLKYTGSINSSYENSTIYLKIKYISNNIEYIRYSQINTASYDEQEGIEIIATENSNITNYTVEEINNLNGLPATDTSGLVYSFEISQDDYSVNTSIYSTNIFGISFSNIEIPSLEDTNGEEIIGYYIVRNKRSEEDKTILDSAIISTLKEENNFIGYGLVNPKLENNTKIKKNIFALNNPKFLFEKTEYSSVSSIIQEGYFKIEDRKLYNGYIEDVQAGTSYDPERNKKREKDYDGFSLKTVSRNSNLSFLPEKRILAQDEDIKDIFYLASLNSKTIIDSDNSSKEVFNVSGDNRVGIMHLNKDLNIDEIFNDKIPYIILKRDLQDYYPYFRTSPYYLETTNISSEDTCTIFNGDSYISPMRYSNSIFYDIRLRNRRNKSGIIRFIVGVVAVLAGVVTAITNPSLGAKIVAFGVSQIASGLEISQMNKAYNELYDSGLKDTLDDVDTNIAFNYNPPDDEIQWFQDVLSNLFFESTVNINWRLGFTNGMSDFLYSPSELSESILTEYMKNKLTALDTNQNSGRLYLGFATAEIYDLNPDYKRRNEQKIFNHLPLEYDCCSKCTEVFSGRYHYSLQSFQEETVDNYRIFLPNNYRDLDGETGIITNILKYNNDLYIHTQEALWKIPKNYQERVYGDIVSFIGTGSYFEIPPQKIVDSDTGNSAGTIYKWGTVKTPYGIFFPSDDGIYKFNTGNLDKISDIGLEQWFYKNVAINNENNNNPSNDIGCGYISVYDSKNERIIFTKRDYTILPDSGIVYNNCYTLSFSLRYNTWISYHSYFPYIYISSNESLYSIIHNSNYIWKHNIEGNYGVFYNRKDGFIIEAISNGNVQTKNNLYFIRLFIDTKKYIEDKIIKVKDIFFDNVVVYNETQSTGILNIVQRENDFELDVIESDDTILSTNKDDIWTISNFRDYVNNPNESLFIYNKEELSNSYIDKEVNNSNINRNKSWFNKTFIKGDYVHIRYFFNKFVNVKFIIKLFQNNSNTSYRS